MTTKRRIPRTAYRSPRDSAFRVLVPAGVALPDVPPDPLQLDWSDMHAQLCKQANVYYVPARKVQAALDKQEKDLMSWRDANGGWLVCTGLKKPVQGAYWAYTAACASYAQAEALGRTIDPRLGFAVVPANCRDLKAVRKEV